MYSCENRMVDVNWNLIWVFFLLFKLVAAPARVRKTKRKARELFLSKFDDRDNIYVERSWNASVESIFCSIKCYLRTEIPQHFRYQISGFSCLWKIHFHRSKRLFIAAKCDVWKGSYRLSLKTYSAKKRRGGGWRWSTKTYLWEFHFTTKFHTKNAITTSPNSLFDGIFLGTFFLSFIEAG